MIKSIYIMLDNGILLFSKNFVEIKYDNNLLIGFFASIANFSREALKSVVKTVDLGEENKLVLHPRTKEKLLSAAIVSTTDNNSLIIDILNNLMLDFTHEFTSYDNPDNIDKMTAEKLVSDNLRRKIFPSIPKLILVSIALLTPLLSILIVLSIYITNTFQNLFEHVQPALILYTSITLLLLTLVPNLISGFLAPDRRYALFNTFVIIIIEVAVYIAFVERLFIQITLANLPINFILSLASAYFGLRLSSRKYLKK
ncbi:MAG: hypothetical protein ACFFBP_11975 [Promethearchaeota archaeon]